MTLKNNIKTIDMLIDDNFGKKGEKERVVFEKEFIDFKVGYLIKEARLKKGLTQKDLADRIGLNKSYISKIENNVKEVRLSNLQRIIEVGLGGNLELKVNF